jgi:hypothetical protein
MVTPMTDDATLPRRDPADVAAALAASLAVVGEDPGAGPLDIRSLAVGLRVGANHPELARYLLGALEGTLESATAAPSPGATEASAPPAPDAPAAPDDEGAAPQDADATPDDEASNGPGAISPASQLLARAARFPFGAARPDPETLFAWAGRLTPNQVPAMGRTVQGMVENGASVDVTRGFGLAWSGGVRLPHQDFERLFRDFTELELTVCSVLAGRDLRDTPPAPAVSGIARMFAGWVGGSGGSPASREADAVLDRGGRHAQLGLVATWNAWMAMRYRDLVPQATFDLLVRPWVTAVGPLPDA